MKNVILCKKILFVAFLIFACVLICQLYGYLTQYICVNAESMIMPYVDYGRNTSNEFLRLFSSSDHSWYIFSFVYMFLERVLPKVLNLHPQDAIVISSKTFLFIVYIGFLSVLTCGLFKYEKNKILFPVGLLLTCFITLCSLQQSNLTWIFSNDCWFLAYMFLPAFGIAIINMAEKFYVFFEKPTPKDITILVVLFLCISVSHEFYKFLLLLMLPAIYFLHYICFKQTVKIISFFKAVAAYVVMSIFLVLNNFSYAYKIWLSDHIGNKFITTADFHVYLSNFMGALKESIFYDNIIYYLLIFALVVIIAFSVQDKDKNKRFFIFNSTLLFASLLFFFCLIVGSDKYDNVSVLPMHEGLRFCLKLSLITIVYSCVGYLISSIKDLYKKIYLFFTFLLVSVFLFGQNFVFLKYIVIGAKTLKINAYILEKVFVLNNKKFDDGMFYTYSRFNCLNDDAVLYLKKVYNISPSKNYKVYHVCADNDTEITCQKNMINLANKKLGYKFTEKELEELSFSSLYKINSP